MKVPWPFRFTKPQLPAGSKPVTAEQAEQLLRQQLQTKQRPQEDVWWDLAVLYSQTARQDEALTIVQRLAEGAETAEKKASCYLAMGQLMERMQEFAQAIKCYSQAMVLEPINGETWYLIHNNLGYCLNHFGRHPEAEPYLRRAIQIDPARHNAYKNLGIALQGQGDFAGAAVCYITAVQANAADPRALRHLEELVAGHPAVAVDVAEFEEKLNACRLAVQEAHRVREEFMAQWNNKGTAAP